MVVVFCGGLRVEEVFPALLKVMLQFWEETRKNNDCLYFMLTLKGRFKGDTG